MRKNIQLIWIKSSWSTIWRFKVLYYNVIKEFANYQDRYAENSLEIEYFKQVIKEFSNEKKNNFSTVKLDVIKLQLIHY